MALPTNEQEFNMRITKKEINGIKVKGYRDANEWVVQAGDMLPQNFNAHKWTLKEAMRLAVEIASC